MSATVAASSYSLPLLQNAARRWLYVRSSLNGYSESDRRTQMLAAVPRLALVSPFNDVPNVNTHSFVHDVFGDIGRSHDEVDVFVPVSGVSRYHVADQMKNFIALFIVENIDRRVSVCVVIGPAFLKGQHLPIVARVAFGKMPRFAAVTSYGFATLTRHTVG